MAAAEDSINPITVSNNGGLEGYSNACLWIAVLDYLKCCLGHSDLTLSELRLRFDPYGTIGRWQEFDMGIHSQIFQQLADFYNLRLEFYPLRRDGSISQTPIQALGNGRNIVPILSFGDHFELIVNTGILLNCQDFGKNCPSIRRRVGNYEPKMDYNHDGIFELTKSQLDIEKQISKDEELARQLAREEREASESDVELARQLQREEDEAEAAIIAIKRAAQEQTDLELARMLAAESEKGYPDYKYTMYDIVIHNTTIPLTSKATIDRLMYKYGITEYKILPNPNGPIGSLIVVFNRIIPGMDMNGQNTWTFIDFKIRPNN